MAGLTGRMSTVVKAKVSKLLDRAEDPAETLDYSYQKQVEQLQNVKKGIADVVTAKKRLQMQETTLQAERRQARHAGPPGAVLRPGGPRPSGAGAQERRPDGAAGARHAGRRTGRAAAEADRLRAEAAREDRGVPHEEGGHQGAVLRRRSPGADLRGRDRRRRADGRRRPGDAARGRQDRKHESPRRCRLRAGSRRDVRRHHRARLRRRRHRPPAEVAVQQVGRRRRSRQDEGGNRDGRRWRRPCARRGDRRAAERARAGRGCRTDAAGRGRGGQS